MIEPKNLSNLHLNRNSLCEPFYDILIEISIVRASLDTRHCFKAPRSWCMLHNLAENSTEAGEMYVSPLSGNMFSVYTRFAVRVLIFLRDLDGMALKRAWNHYVWQRLNWLWLPAKMPTADNKLLKAFCFDFISPDHLPNTSLNDLFVYCQDSRFTLVALVCLAAHQVTLLTLAAWSIATSEGRIS